MKLLHGVAVQYFLLQRSVMSYKTPAAPAEAEFIEKKSRFIGYISPAVNEQQAIDFINKIRALHRKATMGVLHFFRHPLHRFVAVLRLQA